MTVGGVCQKISSLKGIEFEEEMKTNLRPSRLDLANSYGREVQDFGLPGNEYARVVRVEKDRTSNAEVAVYKLYIDNETYTQWVVTIAVCDCPEIHVMHSDFVRHRGGWIYVPWEVAAD